MDNNKTEEIARLNDDFRHHLSKGTLVLTSGIRCNTKEDIAEIIARVRNFNDFDEDNDPYGERDFGAFDFKGKKIFWKIDYYDQEFLYLSPDVSSPRLKNKVTAHEKADIGFDETILGLLDIATQARNIFDRSQNLELKRLLLKFVFESLTLTEGTLTYKLKFPFEMFVDNNILRAKAAKSYEPMQTLEKQGIQANDNENLQMGYMNFYEPQISDKNQEVTLKNATSLQIGDA